MFGVSLDEEIDSLQMKGYEIDSRYDSIRDEQHIQIKKGDFVVEGLIPFNAFVSPDNADDVIFWKIRELIARLELMMGA